MIAAHEFENLLRLFGGPLADVKVQSKTSADALLRPWIIDVTGVCNIHGKAVVFEVEDFDLHAIKSNDDVLSFAGKLLESFNAAAAAPDFRPRETN